MTKEEILREDFKRAFQRINEYTVSTGLNVDEADGPEKDDDGAAAQDAPQDANGGADPTGGPMPPVDGGEGADGDAAGPMGGTDPNMQGAADSADGAVPPQGLNPQGAEGEMPDVSMDPNMAPEGEGQEQPDDTVIDVTDITDSQKDIEGEIAHINDKYEKVIKALGAFETLIKTSNEKIDDLKSEYEKRNPTQVEKLSMQTAHSYPFNVTPEDYWKNKEATSNYSTASDDNGKEQGQYVITQNDVNGDTNWKAISDSLDDEDLMYNQSLNNLFKY